MRQVTLHIPDKKYPLFIAMAKSLDFVKKIEEDGPEPTKKQILDNIKAGIEEVHLFKKGKLKTTPAKDFLSEL